MPENSCLLKGQGVEAARSQARSAAGLANAVLRHIAQEDAPRVAAAREAVRHAAAGEGTATHEELSLASGIPVWLCERLERDLGGRDVARLCAAQLEPAGAYVQVNPLVMSDDAAYDALAERGIAATPCALPGSLELAAAAGLGPSGLVDDVALVPCDLAAQMVCAVAVPASSPAPVRMLEVGQGRAAKSILVQAAAHRAGATVNVDAIELHASRVQLARERLARAGIECVTCHALDARDLAREDVLPGVRAQVALVDAPCSGTGTMRRHPEIPATLEPSALDARAQDSLPALQLQILSAAATRVQAGGVLLYSTCSVVRAENEGVVESFLASREGADFALLSLAEAPGTSALPASARDAVLAHEKGHGLFATVPSVGGPDGHFLACMVRS